MLQTDLLLDSPTSHTSGEERQRPLVDLVQRRPHGAHREQDALEGEQHRHVLVAGAEPVEIHRAAVIIEPGASLRAFHDDVLAQEDRSATDPT